MRQDDLDLVFKGRSQLGKEALPAGTPQLARLKARIEQADELQEGQILLGIESEGKLIGDIQTYRPADRQLASAVYEIGVALYDPADRGKSLGTEATRLFVDWLFTQGAREVQGGTAVTNQPMRRVFEKLGFITVSDLEVGGVKELLYRVTRVDWHS